MTKDTNTASGAAIQRYKIGYHADECGQRSSTPSGIPDASGSWVRYADHVTALAAGQATAAPQGVAYADAHGAIMGAAYDFRDAHISGSPNQKRSAHAALESAVTHALRASHGQAPAGATEEVENLRKALVYAAFALHDTPQYMLAQGITLIDGDTVRVSRDGWTVEASVNPHRQPAPAPPPECETEAEKRAFAFGWFKSLESERMKADSVREDAARLKEVVGLLEELAEHDNYHAEYDGRMIAICPECGEQEGEHRPGCAFVRAKAYLAARAAQKEKS